MQAPRKKSSWRGVRSSNSNSAPHRTVESSSIFVITNAYCRIVNGIQKPQHGVVQLEARNDKIDPEELNNSSVILSGVGNLPACKHSIVSIFF